MEDRKHGHWIEDDSETYTPNHDTWEDCELMDNDKLVKVEFIESYIKHGNGDYKWNDNHGELIRCKNCKHYDEQCQQCEKIDGIIQPDFYCADGELAEQNVTI